MYVYFVKQSAHRVYTHLYAASVSSECDFTPGKQDSFGVWRWVRSWIWCWAMCCACTNALNYNQDHCIAWLNVQGKFLVNTVQWNDKWGVQPQTRSNTRPDKTSRCTERLTWKKGHFLFSSRFRFCEIAHRNNKNWKGQRIKGSFKSL